jgi:type VI secretion system protein ImpI
MLEMALRLSIENETSLPDGGPLSVSVSGKRGLDIGRDQYLDWTLPDPSRTVSGKHCEIRFHDGGYWIHDVSTNGTFLNGSDRRLPAPHRLRHGDRLEIGHYIIAVALDGEEAQGDVDRSAPVVSGFGSSDLWSPAGDAAPPLPRRDLQPARETKPVRPDFLDWAIDTPASSFDHAPLPPLPAESRHEDEMDWARAPAPIPVQPPPVTPVPTPRRPGASAPSGPDPWGNAGPHDDSRQDVTPVEFPAPWSEPPPRPDIAPPAEPAAPMPPPATGGSSSSDMAFMRAFARGAGIPEEVVAWRNDEELAELLGTLMRVIAEDLKQLLMARAESKRLARSTNQTMVQAVDNNPLKFSPTPEDALRLMFGKPTSGYLDARRTLEQSFKDLKIHQVKTYAAMQHALRMLVEDLDPQAIAESTEADKGLAALVGSRKAKMWDTFAARWQAKTAPHEDGLVDAFMLYFAECYDRSGGKPR